MATFNVNLINKIQDSSKKIRISAEEFILDRAEQEGMKLPYSCRTGCCFDCMGKLIEGKVEQTAKALEFLSPEELAAGYVLTCSASPCSDCIIITHQADELLD